MDSFHAPEKKESTRATRSFDGYFIQPKLSVNRPGDIYEQEADAMADRVMTMQYPVQQSNREKPFFSPATTGLNRKQHLPEDELDKEIVHRKETDGVQRKCAGCEEEEKKVQRKEKSGFESGKDAEPDSYLSSLHQSGRPLPESSRSFFEPRFGRDFSNVRIHADDVAAQSAQSINALAYTAGNDIVFGSQQFAPDTDTGKKLIAHELTHVVQQNQTAAPKQIQRLKISPVGGLVKGTCGQFARDYDFALGTAAATDGYIVQQIDRYDNEVKCPGGGACPAKPTTYWEAFFVSKGTSVFYRRKASGLSDTSGHEARPNTSGSRYAFGEARYFPIAVTGDLGKDNIAGIWKPGRAGGVLASRSLPSTASPPGWWGNYTEGPATRAVFADWRCCGDSSDFYDLSANP